MSTPSTTDTTRSTTGSTMDAPAAGTRAARADRG
jgi:hypothetical protein